MDGDGLFVKDGAPVKFYFHKSIRQRCDQISRDIERHGGQVVNDERSANVLLVNEQEDIKFLRRQYYSSTELYRLSLYVEPRGFVQACIRSGMYQHVGPVKQGMPGRAPGSGAKLRVSFTAEDRDHLAYYLATRCPRRDGRMGNSAYKDLEQLGRTKDASWAWARRHTWSSWREHYKTHTDVMDPPIDRYVQRLKNTGHHFGHDPRCHDHLKPRQQLAEEEEEQPWEGIEPQGPQDHQHGDEEQGVVIIEPHRVKRHRVPPDVCHPHETPGTRAKRARLSTDGGDGELTGEHMEVREPQDIEGGDLFGDPEYTGIANLALLFHPRQEGSSSSTQATPIASSRFSEKESMPSLTPVVEASLWSVEPPPHPQWEDAEDTDRYEESDEDCSALQRYEVVDFELLDSEEDIR